MQPIEDKLYSPFQRRGKKVGKKSNGHWDLIEEIKWERFDATVNKVRANDGFVVKSFRDLVDEVADVTLNNKKYEMYYRGQVEDVKNNKSLYYKDRTKKSTVYPTICRPDKKIDGSPKYSIRKSEIKKRYEDLSKLISLCPWKNYQLEFYYALFQHYNIFPTPLIDITQSLRVAATFALRKSKKGFIYVFGLPYPNQSISYYLDLGIVLVKLQNVVLPTAKRPRYQEGYLVGNYPSKPTKTNADDLANRMIAKFQLDNSHGKFWDDFFQPMPEEVLYPSDDHVEMQLKKVKSTFDDMYNKKFK